jgi:predicted dehydrogenase
MEKLKVGIIGCGNISSIYFTNCQTFHSLDIVACADLDVERAQAKAEEFHVPKACSVQELLADPEIDIVINLTIPAAHAEVSLSALEAGKHVYVEKPLAISLEDGRKIVKVAKSKGLLVGGAPDTFLGGGIQTCIKLVKDGWIGRPVAANAFFMSNGVEGWHPNPDFFYQTGGGPMFDMGPYYITALISLIGSVKRVTGSAKISFPERETPEGRKIPVEIPTHISGVLDFENGAVGTLITSFDSWGSNLPRIEIYGEHGTLSVPDPNTFGGPVKFRRKGEKEFQEVPLTHGYTKNSRGIGLADMAEAIQEGRPHRANSDLTFHVLEIMHGFHIASEEGRHYKVTSSVDRPKLVEMNKKF